jgi:hypothetical protein
MNVHRILTRVALFLVVVGGALLVLAAAPRADSMSSVPGIVQDGLHSWEKNGASYALDIWQKGGLMEGDNKPMALSNYFRRIDRIIGNYRSFEVIDTKRISQRSEVLYLSMNFERTAIYARFLLFRTEKDWVVQNMDFSPRPEAIMPWLAFEGVNYGE